MTDFERRLATVLKDAPGEPPLLLDGDAIREGAAGHRRARAWTPLAAVVVVVVLAGSVAVLLGHLPSHQGASAHSAPPISATSPAPPTRPATTNSSSPAKPVVDPHQIAIRTAEQLIDTAAVVPGATRRDSVPVSILEQPAAAPGLQHVQRSRFWVAPTGVEAAISYLKAHRPVGMSSDGGQQLGGPGIPENDSLTFEKADKTSLSYTVVAYRGGIAIRADAEVLWVPARSPADTVPPATVTAVDVVVTRQNPEADHSAPTVVRTLTGSGARALTQYVNGITRAGGGEYRCAEINVHETWQDHVTFHTPQQTATVLVNLAGCSSTTFQIGSRKAIELSAVGSLDSRILAAIGLPNGYGGNP